ncbi:hypothetical protein ACPPVO_14635 [Dactylosporangium sp. McL0621]
MHVPTTLPTGKAKVTWMAAMADGTVAVANLATDGASVEILE